MGIYPPPKLGHLRRHDVPDENQNENPPLAVLCQLTPAAAPFWVGCAAVLEPWHMRTDV
jgi:hypothetical protein